MTCPIAANSADLSNASQLISVFFTMLWRLDGGFDLASRQWIEHGVSTVDWTWRLSDCLSGKSIRIMPGGRFVGEGGFRSQELDGCEMTLGFRQVRAARERNTLHPVLCVLYELDDDE